MRKGIALPISEKIEAIFSTGQKNIYFARSNYKDTIENLESFIDKKNIVYLFYEDFFTEKSIELNCQFLSIDRKAAEFKKQVNMGSNSDSSLDIYSHVPAENIYGPIYNHCRSKFSTSVPSRWLSE